MFSDLCVKYLEYSKEFDKISTHLKKESITEFYLNKFFGKYKLNQIDSKLVTDFKIFLNNENLSTNYKRFIFNMLNSIFNFAIKFGYVNEKKFCICKELQ